MFLGTAAYMAPEQARGAIIDKRADIWAFGVVLFEMLTGQRLFDEGTISDTLANVLKSEPEWKRLPSTTPPSLHRLLRRCLEKDRKRRLQDIGDARAELEAREEHDSAPPMARRSALLAPASIAAAALAIGIAGTWMLKPERETPAQPVIRMSFPLASGVRAGSGARRFLAIAPDGQTIAVITTDGLLIRRISESRFVTIGGTTDAIGLFFSPDSRWVGFWTATHLKKVPVSGGSIGVIAPIADEVGGIRGAAWAKNDRIYYSTLRGIVMVSTSGSAPQLSISIAEASHPTLLPDERSFLINRGSPIAGVQSSNAMVVVWQPREGGEARVISPGIQPRFISPGYVAFNRGGTLFAVAIDSTTGQTKGEPIAVAEGLGDGNNSQFDISDNGTLVSFTAAVEVDARLNLERIDRHGASTPISGQPLTYADVRLSPDGERLATHVHAQDDDVWVRDLRRGTMSRITYHPLEEETPVWSRDGLWLAYSGSARQGEGRVVARRRADGTGDEEILWNGAEHTHVSDWSPDGKTLVVELQDPTLRSNIELLDLETRSKLRPFLKTPFSESQARLSPDGRWMAYRSDESGRNEIYVQAFPSGGAKTLISTNNGTQPIWSRDGSELYYRSGTELMSARVRLEQQSLVAETPKPLFKESYPTTLGPFGHFGYDVFPDGTFLFMETADREDRSASPQVNAVFNWFEEVKNIVPLGPTRAR